MRVWDRDTGAVLADSTGNGQMFSNFPPGGRRCSHRTGARWWRSCSTADDVEDLVVLDATTLAPVGGEPVPLVSTARVVAVTPDGRAAVVIASSHRSSPEDQGAPRRSRDASHRAFDAGRGTRPASPSAGTKQHGGTGWSDRRPRRPRGDVVVVDAVTGEVSPLLHGSRRRRGERHVRAGRRQLRHDGAGRRREAVGHRDAATSSAPSLPLGPNHRVRASFLAADRVLIV